MAKSVPKKKHVSNTANSSMSFEQKLAWLKVACVVGAGLLASLALWLMSK